MMHEPDSDALDRTLRNYFAAELPQGFRPPVWNAAPTSPSMAYFARNGTPGRATLALSLIALAALGSALLVKPNPKIGPVPAREELLKNATADGSKLGLPPAER